jgi:predicted P-loop ATPase
MTVKSIPQVATNDAEQAAEAFAADFLAEKKRQANGTYGASLIKERKFALDEIGNPDAPVGSHDWSLWTANQIRMSLYDKQQSEHRLHLLMDSFKTQSGWQELGFKTWGAFCESRLQKSAIEVETEASLNEAIEKADKVSPVDDLRWLADQGVRFSLPKGRTKGKFDAGWQNTPHTIDEAIKHAKAGGNVGILTGKHSGNVIAIDRDVDFPDTCAMLGEFGKTAKIIRDNAPDRGKLLFRIVDGDIPPTISWKENPTDKHPACEFLGDNGQRHAICPPSIFDSGNYVLIDKEYGIQEITLIELDFIWRVITGGSIHEDVRTKEEEEAYRHAKDDYIKQVFEHWTTKKIFEHFDKASNGTEKDGKQTRILGNGGLLIGSNNEQWSIPAEKIGGGPLQAWIYCTSGKVEKPTGKDFWKWINKMGDAAGIERPKQPESALVQAKNKKKAQKANPNIDPVTGAFKSTQDVWLDLLRDLGYTFKLNVLEDMVEIDGKRLDDVTRSKIYLRMVPTGIPKHYIDDMINVLASENTYHPVQDYLNNLVWDGKDHLTAMLQYIRGDDREVTYDDGKKAQLHWLLIRRWLLGCVARALDGDKEGAFKHQTPMLVFIGKQGLGKSSWVRWLVSGVGYEFHRESSINPHAPDDVRSMVTKWIWEASELGSSLRRGDRDALKGFITQEWHTYRKPWGRASITKPTLCNFVGTINPEIGFLDDPTGHRRFLPVTITALNHDYKQVVDVNQLWAQLVHLYRNGTSPELSKLEKQALSTTYEDHEVENPIETYLHMYFKIEPGNTKLKCFTAEIMQRLQAFGINISNNPQIAGREINKVLAPMKLTRKKVSIGGGKGWGWEGIEPNIIPVPKPYTPAVGREN